TDRLGPPRPGALRSRAQRPLAASPDLVCARMRCLLGPGPRGNAVLRGPVRARAGAPRASGYGLGRRAPCAGARVLFPGLLRPDAPERSLRGGLLAAAAGPARARGLLQPGLRGAGLPLPEPRAVAGRAAGVPERLRGLHAGRLPALRRLPDLSCIRIGRAPARPAPDPCAPAPIRTRGRTGRAAGAWRGAWRRRGGASTGR